VDAISDLDSSGSQLASTLILSVSSALRSLPTPGPPTRAEKPLQGKMAFLLLLVHLFFALVGASPFAPSGGLGKFNVKATRNQHYNPNGLAQYAKALSKWGCDVPKGLASYVSNKGQGKVAQPLYVDALSLTPNSQLCRRGAV
jgi:hypothetical protein